MRDRTDHSHSGLGKDESWRSPEHMGQGFYGGWCYGQRLGMTRLGHPRPVTPRPPGYRREARARRRRQVHAVRRTDPAGEVLGGDVGQKIDVVVVGVEAGDVGEFFRRRLLRRLRGSLPGFLRGVSTQSAEKPGAMRAIFLWPRFREVGDVLDGVRAQPFLLAEEGLEGDLGACPQASRVLPGAALRSSGIGSGRDRPPTDSVWGRRGRR